MQVLIPAVLSYVAICGLAFYFLATSRKKPRGWIDEPQLPPVKRRAADEIERDIAELVERDKDRRARREAFRESIKRDHKAW